LAIPKYPELALAIEIVEDLMNFFYELDYKSSQLKELRKKKILRSGKQRKAVPIGLHTHSTKLTSVNPPCRRGSLFNAHADYTTLVAQQKVYTWPLPLVYTQPSATSHTAGKARDYSC
jgi:hypothetical protein